jgi:N-hydroxyarylamine O-acetyltransferase
MLKPYIDFLGIAYPIKKTIDFVNKFHKVHIETICHCNINFIIKNQIKYNFNDIVTRLMVKRCGGVCYDLNFLFSQILNQIGYNATAIPAEVYAFGSEILPKSYLVHTVVLIKMSKHFYLADVGNCNSFRYPIKLIASGSNKVRDISGVYSLVNDSNNKYCYSLYKVYDGKSIKQYSFSINDNPFDSIKICSYVPSYIKWPNIYNHFTCILPMNCGYKYIKQNKFIKKTNDDKQIININNIDEMLDLLKYEFNFSNDFIQSIDSSNLEKVVFEYL